MALQGDRLYALVGGREIQPGNAAVQRARHGPLAVGDVGRPRLQGSADQFRFRPHAPGRRSGHQGKSSGIIARKNIVDARGVCMKDGRIYYYSPGKFLGCLEAASGRVVWKNSDRDLLDAIGRDGPAQLWITGYATTTFIKCNDRDIFFAGPQRQPAGGRLDRKRQTSLAEGSRQPATGPPRRCDLWRRRRAMPTGFKLGLRDREKLGRVAGPAGLHPGHGHGRQHLLPRNGGTVRIDLASDTAKHIAPMRPPCQDGVIVSDGLLYWGPWMCGCQLSLYGHVCLGPAGRFNFHPPAAASRLAAAGDPSAVASRFRGYPGDWPTYLHDSRGAASARSACRSRWRGDGSIRCRARSAPPPRSSPADWCLWATTAARFARWMPRTARSAGRRYTGGAIFFPPAIWQGRLYAGSADGRVYAYEAATGRLLWSFRAAPADRWIPVYGRLMSTWPVAGGVVAEEGVVYAAAGIAHYDGTYVYALDAVTGRVKWCNDTSGNLSEKVDCGVSLQGPLSLAGERTAVPWRRQVRDGPLRSGNRQMSQRTGQYARRRSSARPFIPTFPTTDGTCRSATFWPTARNGSMTPATRGASTRLWRCWLPPRAARHGYRSKRLVGRKPRPKARGGRLYGPTRRAAVSTVLS